MTCLSRGLRTLVSPRQSIVGNDGVKQFKHEVYCPLYAAAGQVIAAFRTTVRIAYDRQTTIETESNEICISHQTSGLVLDTSLFSIGHAWHIVNLFNYNPTVAHVLPNKLIGIRIDVTILITIDSGSQ